MSNEWAAGKDEGIVMLSLRNVCRFSNGLVLIGVAACGGGGRANNPTHTPGGPVTPAVNRNWQMPAPLETSDAGAVEMPAIAMNGSGNAALVWRRYSPNTSEVWSSQYSTSSKGWSTAAPVALNTGTSNVGTTAVPEIAIDGNGNVVAVWQQYQNAVWGVWANQFSPGAGWATAVRIDSILGPSNSPRVSFDSGGNALAVWEQSDGTSSHIWSNTLPAGATIWHGPTQIDTNAGISGSPQICADGRGNVLVVWTQAATLAAPIYQVWSSSYVHNASAWAPPVLVGSSPMGGAFNARVVCNATGAVFALWEQMDDNSLWSNRYSFATGWTTAAQIRTNGTAPTAPQIAVDSGGNAMAVWYEFDASGMDSHTWYAYYSANSGWGVAVQLSHDNAGVTDRAEDPQVGFDATGNALAIWNRFDGTLEFNTSSLYTPGTGWAEAVDVENEGAVLSPVLAVAPSGDALAVWEQANDQAPGALLWQNRFE